MILKIIVVYSFQKQIASRKSNSLNLISRSNFFHPPVNIPLPIHYPNDAVFLYHVRFMRVSILR